MGFATTKNAPNDVLPNLHQFIATKLKGELKCCDYEDKFKDIIPHETEAYKARIHQIQLWQERKAEKEKEKKESMTLKSVQRSKS